MKSLLLFLFVIAISTTFAKDSLYLKVHFLYGSKPSSKFKSSQQKWFGGTLGGHVGIESQDNKILNFLPKGQFHKIPSTNNKHSRYAVSDSVHFYNILGGQSDSNKLCVVYIPVSLAQKKQFDSIYHAYLNETPYDYALFGMRCGAAAYDILSQLKILPRYSLKKISRKIFYPKKLRKRLLKKAKSKKWLVVRHAGTYQRIWEKD